jgi:hypothetical protein
MAFIIAFAPMFAKIQLMSHIITCLISLVIMQKLLVFLVSQQLTSNIFVERLKLITQMGWSRDCVASDYEFNTFKVVVSFIQFMKCHHLVNFIHVIEFSLVEKFHCLVHFIHVVKLHQLIHFIHMVFLIIYVVNY